MAASGAEIAYIDESYDDHVFVMSALIIPAHGWRESFLRLQQYRRHLKAKYGIFTSKELHATEFVAGRGRISATVVPKGLRAHLFNEVLQVVCGLPGASVISGAWPRPGQSQNEIHAKTFARIQERLQRRCSGRTRRCCWWWMKARRPNFARISPAEQGVESDRPRYGCSGRTGRLQEEYPE